MVHDLDNTMGIEVAQRPWFETGWQSRLDLGARASIRLVWDDSCWLRPARSIPLSRATCLRGAGSAGEAAVEGGVPGLLPLLASHPRWLFATTLPACSLSLYTLTQHSSLSLSLAFWLMLGNEATQWTE
jgi:hypothetical protein